MVTFDTTSNSGYQAAASTYNWAHTAGRGLNSILVVGVSLLSVAGNQVNSITYNGQVLTQIRADTSVSTVVRTELWYLKNPNIGSNTIVVTLSTATDSVTGALGSAAGGRDGAAANIGGYFPMETNANITGTWVVSAVALLPVGALPHNRYRNIQVGNNTSRSERAS